MDRPNIEAIREYLNTASDCDGFDLREMETLFTYIAGLEVERDELASWLDTLRDLPDGASLRDYRKDEKRWGE